MLTPTTTDSVFDHDRYLIRHRAGVLADIHEIRGINETLLATVRAPVRWLRHWIGAFAIVVTWLAAWSAAAFAIAGALAQFGIVPQHPKDDISAAIGFGGMVLGILPAYLMSLVVPPPYTARFYAPGDAGPILQVAEKRRFLPIRRRFVVSTPEGAPIARCSKGNYPLVFGVRLTCDRPDGTPLFEVRDAAGVAGFPERALQQATGAPRSGYVFRRVDLADGEPLGVIAKADHGGDRVVLDLTADSTLAIDRRVGLALAVLVESGGWI